MGHHAYAYIHSKTVVQRFLTTAGRRRDPAIEFV